MSSALIKRVQTHPNQVFKFIVLGSKGAKSSKIARVIGSGYGHTVHTYTSIPGVTATITGAQLHRLAVTYPKLLQSVTLDKPVKTADYQDAQMWPDSADLSMLWSGFDPNTGEVTGPAPQAPAIAFIDSGINAADTVDFGSRVVASVSFCSLCTDSTSATTSSAAAPVSSSAASATDPTAAPAAPAAPVADPSATAITTASNTDAEGHGTMVAGIAAGSSADYPGVAQNAPIVSVRVANKDGESMESDVIAACDWILANKDTYGIKVVNISMAGTSPATFQNDPLDQAVERLWFSGVTVVAAAGNFGTGSAVDMSPAPGNDPFIITVGALDQNQTSDTSDDTVAPWSAYGYTADGFSKPDISAPGRYMVMPVPMGTTIPTTVPDRVVAPGYMWMSGTSFAAPVVAGAAAQILALHPDWTPDQVKGALMLSANYLPNVTLAGGRRGRGRRGDGCISGGLRRHPAEPEREPRHVRVDGSVDRYAGVRLGRLGERGVHGRGVELGGVELGGLGECSLGECSLGERGVELGRVGLGHERRDVQPRHLHRGDVPTVGRVDRQQRTEQWRPSGPPLLV